MYALLKFIYRSGLLFLPFIFYYYAKIEAILFALQAYCPGGAL